MRIWHKDLIDVLPRKQLLSQWRELKCMVVNINNNGTPNHVLVNKIMDYDFDHLCSYATLIFNEMNKRGYKVNINVLNDIYKIKQEFQNIKYENIFCKWHNTRYLKQCLFNLQEKFDCKAISNEEWKKIYKKFQKVLDI